MRLNAIIRITVVTLLFLSGSSMRAQTVEADSTLLPNDSIVAAVDSIFATMQADSILQMADSAQKAVSSVMLEDS